MKNLIKILTSILFSLEITLPHLAWAKPVPMPSPILMDRAPAELKKRISRKIARDVFRRYQAVKTGKDFENLFIGKLPEKDRKEVLEKRFPVKEYPSLTLNDDVLIYKWKGYTLTLQVTEIWNNKVRINGKDWTFSDRISAAKNMDNLESFLEKLDRQKGAEHVLFKLMVPDAHAIGALLGWAAAVIGGTILGAIATGAGTTAMDNVCAYAKEKKNVDLRDWYIPGCANYYANRDAHAKSLSSATSVMDIDKLNELLDMFEIEPVKCPEKGAKDFTIKTRMRRSETNPESIPQAPLPSGNLLSTKAEPFINGATPVNVAVPEVKDGVVTVKDQAPSIPGLSQTSAPVTDATAAAPVAPAAPAPSTSASVVPAPAPVTKESLRAWSRVELSVKEGKVDSMTIATDDPDDPKVPDKNVVCRINFNPDGTVKSLAIRNRLFDPKDPSAKPVLEYSAISVWNRVHETESSSEVEADLTARQQSAIEMSKYLNQRIMNDSLRECRKNQKIQSDGSSAGSDKTGDSKSGAKSGSK